VEPLKSWRIPTIDLAEWVESQWVMVAYPGFAGPCPEVKKVVAGLKVHAFAVVPSYEADHRYVGQSWVEAEEWGVASALSPMDNKTREIQTKSRAQFVKSLLRW